MHGRGEQGGVRRSLADSHGSRGRGGLLRGGGVEDRLVAREEGGGGEAV